MSWKIPLYAVSSWSGVSIRKFFAHVAPDYVRGIKKTADLRDALYTFILSQRPRSKSVKPTVELGLWSRTVLVPDREFLAVEFYGGEYTAVPAISARHNLIVFSDGKPVVGPRKPVGWVSAKALGYKSVTTFSKEIEGIVKRLPIRALDYLEEAGATSKYISTDYFDGRISWSMLTAHVEDPA